MKSTLTAALLLIAPVIGWGQHISYWSPAVNTSWQWQLSGTIDQTVSAAVYDVDLFTTDASVLTALHAKGRRAICYVSAGSWEDYRPDAAQFPESVKGQVLAGYPNERWLDIRNLTVLGPIMSARLDLCKAKGFDAVEPDNVDGYTNVTGFPLTAADQIRYNTWFASAAHARGLSVGLKNDIDQVAALQPVFDWAINEQCFQFKECGALSAFVNAGKAVFQVEYKLTAAQFCTQANSMNFNSMRKNLSLDAFREPCRTGSQKAIQVFDGGTVNAAALRADVVAPGELVSIFGSGVGPALGSALAMDANGLATTSLDDVRVSFDGIPAPLVYVQSGQINAAVPYQVKGKGTVQMQVEYRGIQADPVTLNVSDTAPGIFAADGGKGQGAILNEDGNPNSASNPAAAGSIAVLFATGEGETTPVGVNGKIATDAPPKPVAPVSVSVGGQDAQVLYAGGAPGLIAGVLQVNFRIPPGVAAGPGVPVQLTVGTVSSQPGVTMSIR